MANEVESTIPRLTIKDFEDTTLYRVNSVLAEIARNAANAGADASEAKRKVIEMEGSGYSRDDTPTVPIDEGGSGEEPPPQPTSADWSIANPTNANSDYRANSVGNQFVRLQPTLINLPTGADYLDFWVYKGASPPTDLGQWQYLGSCSEPGTTDSWQEQPRTGETWVVCATGSLTTYRQLPLSDSDYKTVTIDAWQDAPALTSPSVTPVSDGVVNGFEKGHFECDATVDQTAANFHHVKIIRRWTSASYAAPKSEWFEVFGPESMPFVQSRESWDWPEDEWTEWMFASVNHAMDENWCSTVVQVHMSGGGVFDVSYIELGEGLAAVGGAIVSTAKQTTKNGNFDFGLTDWAPTGTVVSQSTVAYSGNAAKISADGTLNYISQTIPIVPGQAIAIEAYFNNQTNAAVPLVASFSGPTGSWVATTESSPCANDSTWKKVTLVAVAPTGAAFVSIVPGYLASSFTSGFLYVDSVSYHIVEPIAGSSPIARTTDGINLSLESTEFHVVSGKLTQSGVNFSKAIVGTYNGSEFEVSGSALRIKELSATKIATGVLSVGGPSMVSKFAVFDTLGNAIGWVGDDSGVSGYVGAWFKQIRVGGSTPAGAKIAADSSGNVAIVNATFSMSKGVTYGATTYTVVTTINPAAEYNYTVGMKVEDQSGSGAGNNGAGVYVSPTGIYIKRATLLISTAETNLMPGRIDFGYSTTTGATLQGSVGGSGALLLDPSNVGGALNSFVSICGGIVLRSRQTAPTAPPSSSTATAPVGLGSGWSAGASYTSNEQSMLNLLRTESAVQGTYNAEIQTTLNSLITSVNSLISKLNTSGHGLIA